MNIVASSTSATGAASAPSTAAQQARVDYNSFLKLLVSELKNQDPTKPTDATQYLGQLASFSSVEQQIQSNAKLDALLTAFSLGQAAGLIGQTMTSADGATSGVVATVRIDSAGPVAILADGRELPAGAGVSLSR